MAHKKYKVISYTKGNTFHYDNTVKLYYCFQHTVVETNIGTFYIKPLFRTDGGSVPKYLQWLIPAWSETNDLLRLAYVIHDACYGAELLPKEIADELLHSMLLDAGLSKTKSMLVCEAVSLFAKRHYGIVNDDLENVDYCSYIPNAKNKV